MTYIWACSCGHETEVPYHRFDVGAVHYCRSCRNWFGCIRNGKTGEKIWIPIEKSLAKFHNLGMTK